MRRIGVILLCIFTLIAVERFCHRQTHGFRLHKIYSDLSFNPEWEITPLSTEEENEINSLLDQPFYFLGSGGQSYAFQSADHSVILKVFKHHHMRPDTWLYHLPVPPPFIKGYKQWITEKQQRLDHIFGSCKIAYEHLREETGLLYLHLNKTAHFNKKITIYDNLGIAHQIDLDQIEFALQKKAKLFYSHLSDLIAEKKFERAKDVLLSLLGQIESRCAKGIGDNDLVIQRNFGCIDDRAIEIDLGSYFYRDELQQEKAVAQELFTETEKLVTWLEKTEPSLASFIVEEIRSRHH